MTRQRTLAVLALAACSDSTAPPDSAHPLTTTVAAGSATELKRTLASIRAATAAFHDVTVALAAGYRQGSPCGSRAEGGMGFHYSNRVLMGIVPGTVPIRGTDAVIDPERPELLLYEPTEEGGRRLVGVEYLVFAAAWDAVHDDPPTLAGVPFTLMSGA